VNATTEDRKTVLHWAVEKGQLEIIKQLFKKDVNVSVQDGIGNTPLNLAIKNG
jgi:ankyrin repeat protein